MGIDKTKFVRLRSGIFYTLNKLGEEGHCYGEREQLVKKAKELLEVEEGEIEVTLDEMSAQASDPRMKRLFICRLIISQRAVVPSGCWNFCLPGENLCPMMKGSWKKWYPSLISPTMRSS